MPISPCNNLNVKTIRFSQLASVSANNLTDYDVIYVSQYNNINGVYYSKKTTLLDIVDFINIKGKYSGSFSGSFTGKVFSKNTVSSGSFSGSYFGNVISKNTKVTGSFNGINSKLSGSFSGSYFGNVTSKNTKATGSFSGINNKLSGSFSGSYFGNVTSKNIKATGSFSGINNKLSGSFSGSSYGRFIGNNSLISGSFRGLNNISNFRNTGKSVSFNGTSSYSVFGVTSSYAVTSSYSYANDRIPVFGRFLTDLTGLTLSSSTFTTTPVTISMPSGYTKWDEFDLDVTIGVDDNNSGGDIQGQLQYGDGVNLTISSTSGTGNSTQKYYINNSDDVVVAKWRHMGIVGSSYNTAGTLSFKTLLTITNTSVNSVCLLLKAYAKK